MARLMFVARFSDAAVNVLFRLYAESLCPRLPVFHGLRPRAVLRILLGGLFLGCGHGVLDTILALSWAGT